MFWVWTLLALALFVVPTLFAWIAFQKLCRLFKEIGHRERTYPSGKAISITPTPHGLSGAGNDVSVLRAARTKRRLIAVEREIIKQNRLSVAINRWTKCGLVNPRDVRRISE